MKKIISICMGVIALASLMLVPSGASASPVLTDTGSKVPPGTILRGTNTGILVWTISSGGKGECSKVVLEGAVTENSGSSVKENIEAASFEGTGSGGDCTSPLGQIKVTNPSLPWCFSTNKVGAFTIRGGECSEASRGITFTMDITGVTNCSYPKASINGTYTAEGSSTTFKVSEESFSGSGEGNGIFCPSSFKWDWLYVWETNVSPFDLILVS
jgi:hypothetical protein